MNNETRMSDKAKGKQRAYPVNRETKLGRETTGRLQTKLEPAKIHLGVRFANGDPDMTLEMSPDETGANVMDAVSSWYASGTTELTVLARVLDTGAKTGAYQ